MEVERLIRKSLGRDCSVLDQGSVLGDGKKRDLRASWHPESSLSEWDAGYQGELPNFCPEQPDSWKYYLLRLERLEEEQS